MPLESCANCERSIGKLERPFVYQDSIVCRGCYRNLAGSDGADEDVPPPPSVVAAVQADVARFSLRSASDASLAAAATRQSTWTPQAARGVGQASRRRSTARTVFVSMCLAAVGVGIVLLVLLRNSEAMPIALVPIGLGIGVLLAWVPIGIANDKGREDRAGAIGALSIIGLLCGGLFWIIALVWALALDDRSAGRRGVR